MSERDQDSRTLPKGADDADSAINFSREKRNSRVGSLASPTSSAPHGVYPPINAGSLSAEEQAAQLQENHQALTQAEAAIEADSHSYGTSSNAEDDFADDGYDSDSLQSASTSLTSSVRNFAFENGRRYHKFREGTYNFPNDDTEQDREDMKHAMVMNLCQQLHFAPISENTQRILDMGTGTGIWAIESKSFSGLEEFARRVIEEVG